MGLILIGGGARSRKSRFALELADTRFERPAFIATAEAHDDEMQERIRVHQDERGSGWTTVEEPLDLVGALEAAAQMCDGCVVDCLTLWLSNVLLSPATTKRARSGSYWGNLNLGPGHPSSWLRMRSAAASCRRMRWPAATGIWRAV